MAGRWVEAYDQLPSAAAEGDTCGLTIHGGSGSYSTEYEWREGKWNEIGTTVPWQIRV